MESWDGIEEAVIRRERAKARELRKTNWWRQKIAPGRCYHCHRRIPAAHLTMDHLVPLALGGRSTKSNLVPTCKSCNTKKKTMLPWEWEEYLEKVRESDE